MLEKQGNKCAVTELPTLTKKDVNKFPLQASIDRIDDAKFHTTDNVQLVCLAVQLGRGASSVADVKIHLDKIKCAESIHPFPYY